MKGYFDGNSVGGILSGTAPNQNLNLCIGGTGPSCDIYLYTGYIDEVQVWSSALTAMEVQQFYAESAPRHQLASR